MQNPIDEECAISNGEERMTPRQRWKATFQGRPIDRLATDYWATPEFSAALRSAVGVSGDELWPKLGIDMPMRAKPRRLVEGHPDDPQADMWGIRYEKVEHGTGSYVEAVHHPLANAQSVKDVESFRWPSPDEFDYEPVRTTLASGKGDRFVFGGSYEAFLLYCNIRGLEQAYADLLENEDIAHAILGNIFKFCHEHNRRILEAGGGQIDGLYLAEDLGGQHGPLFSLDVYRRFLRDHQQKMAELAHAHGAYVFYHTDGAARLFMPDLIEVVGIDLLNPLQWRCAGMELPQLVRDFSKHVVFHGGIDNQQTLPFGTIDEVRAQVRWAAQIMVEFGARWICAPCHNIQPVTPVANVLAMYDEVRLLNCLALSRPSADT